MAWAAFGRQNAMDSVSQSDAILNERKVETAAVPTARFLKKGSAEGSCVLAGTAGERVIGVSREGNGPRADVLAGTFSDYAVGDTAVCIERSTGHVYVELSDQTTTSIAEGAAFTTTTGGRAILTTTSGHYVAGRAAKVNTLVTDRSGVKYVRLLPTWHIKEVVP